MIGIRGGHFQVSCGGFGKKTKVLGDIRQRNEVQSNNYQSVLLTGLYVYEGNRKSSIIIMQPWQLYVNNQCPVVDNTRPFHSSTSHRKDRVLRPDSFFGQNRHKKQSRNLSRTFQITNN